MLSFFFVAWLALARFYERRCNARRQLGVDAFSKKPSRSVFAEDASNRRRSKRPIRRPPVFRRRFARLQTCTANVPIANICRHDNSGHEAEDTRDRPLTDREVKRAA